MQQQNPLQSLSSILGIQQQRQALVKQAQDIQTGQYAQQSAQASAQQDQQKNSELQAVGQLAKSAYTSGRYAKPDGTFDNAKFADDVSQVAPTYGQQIAKDATMRAGEVYQNQQTFFNLQKSKQDQVANTVASLAGDPNIDHSKVTDAFEALRQRFPDDRGLSRMLQSTGGAIDPKANGPQLQQILNSMGASMKGDASVTPMSNAAGQVVGRATFSNQLSPVGGAPGLNPSTPQVAGATTAATGGAKQVVEDPITHNKSVIDLQHTGAGTPVNPQRQPGQGEADIAAAGGLTSRIQAAKAADYDRPVVLDALSRARAILSKPDAPDLGSSFEIKTYLKNALSGLGYDTGAATDANELVKNLARAEAGRSEASPIGKTDASRNLLSKGTASTHIDNAAALNVIDQSMATELAGRGYLKAVGKYQGNPVQAQQAESKYLSTPNLIQTYELGLKKSPAEVDQFHKINGLKKGDLDSSVQALKAQGAL
jgi:hypothetical protein